MTTFLFVLAVYAAVAGLVAYARRDRFAGAALIAQRHDALRPRSSGARSGWAPRAPLVDRLCGEVLADVPRGHRALRDVWAAAEEVQRKRIMRQRPWLAPDSDASRGRLWD